MVTIKDVSAKAGVSAATVSRVLSGDESFSVTEETRRSVFDAMESLGYVPYVVRKKKKSQGASQLANSLLVGCVTTSAFSNDMLDQYSYSVYSEMEKAFKQRNIDFQYLASERELADDAFFEKAFKTRYDGIVFMVRMPHELFEKIRAMAPHAVAVNGYYPEIDHVSYDKERSADDAVHYLVSVGRTRIAYIGGPGQLKGSLLTSLRYTGYKLGLEKCGLKLDQSLIKNCYWLVEECFLQTKELLELPKEKRPDAIICGSDSIIFSVFRAIYEKGLRIPKDIAVLSCGMLPVSEYISPSLTSVKTPVKRIANMVAELMQKRMEGMTDPPMEIIFPSKLIIRDST